MQTSHLSRAVRGIAALALFITVLFLPVGPSQAADPPKDPPKKGESDGKSGGKYEEPCDNLVGGGQGYCYKHRWGTWVGDSQNFPGCTAGYVCNTPGGACTDVAKSGHCTLSPNTGTCNCQCL
jgi:hypothetical protein